MKCMMQIEKPGNVPVTLAMTMTVDDWLALREQIKAGAPAGVRYPGWQVIEYIERSVAELQKKIEPKLVSEAD